MKFMVQMNVKKGPYQMEGWSQDDVKRMVGFMDELNSDLKKTGQWVSAEGLVSPDQARHRQGERGWQSVGDGWSVRRDRRNSSPDSGSSTPRVRMRRIASRPACLACPGPGGKPLNMPVEVRAVGEAPKTD